MDERALIAEASSIDTAPSRLRELAAGSSRSVRIAALANHTFDIRELAQLIGSNDVDMSEDAIDAVIARPREFHHIVWDERAALDLVPIRLTEKLDGSYVVSDAAFETFMRGWDSAAAATVAFDVADRASILSLFLREDGDESD